MPRSYASRRRATADSSLCSPHQPVDTVQRPNPTSDAVMPEVPNVRVFTTRSLSTAGVAAEPVELLQPRCDGILVGARQIRERVAKSEPLGLVAAEGVVGQY